MTIILIIILIAILSWYVFPRLVLWFLKNKIEQKTRQFYDRARQQSGAGQYRQQDTWHRPRKKIDPDVGEYVEFEDVRTYTSETTQTSDSTTTVKYETEEQVVDVEWEDLK